MTSFVLRNDRVSSYLQALSRKRRVMVPTKRKSMFVLADVSSTSEICLDYSNLKVPAKELFLPSSEDLFRYRWKDSEVEIEAEVPIARDTVLFGVHPCDAVSLSLLDKVFLEGEYLDPLYAVKRRRTTIVGVACMRPRKTCFCMSVGVNPHGSTGLDALLTDVGKEYVLDIFTNSGRSLSPGLREADQTDIAKRDEVWRLAEKRLESETYRIDKVRSVLDSLPIEYWQRASEKCVGCAICTYLCPTCHCFDICDREVKGEGERFRSWDSCLDSFFTLQASGHNPRPTVKDRMRQRVMHKFSYFVERYGTHCCVGCGRCVQECPVGVDIREIMDDLLRCGDAMFC